MTELTVAAFVLAHFGGVRRVVDFRDDGRDLALELDVPAGVTFERRDPAGASARLGSDDLVVVRATAEPARSWDPGPIMTIVRAIEPGSRLVVLLDDPITLAGLDLLGEAFAAGQVGILEAARVVDAEVQAALLGRHSDQPPDEIRLANRGRLLALLPDGSGPDSPDDPWESANAREIRRLRRQAQADEARITELETSAYYRVGKAALGAMRQPRRIASLVPRARRAWTRQGKASQPRRPARGRSRDEALAAWHDALGQRPQHLFRAYSAAGGDPRTGLVIAAIIRDETAAALRLDADIHRLGPNDALLGLGQADPDLVLVETGAFSAGLPWAYVGSAAAVDRDRILAAVLEEGRRLGRPSVLWQSPAVPSPVGIQPFHRRFDLVVGDQHSVDPDAAAAEQGWHLGVQLARFNGNALEPAQSGPPLFVGAWDPRAPLADRRRLEEILAAGLEAGLELRVDARSIAGIEAFPEALGLDRAGLRVGRVDPAATAPLYRAHPVVLADALGRGDGRRRALEAMACGARVVGPPDPVLAAVASDGYRPVAGPGDGSAVLAEAIRAGALNATQLRPISRRIFRDHAVPIGLAGLTSRLGLRVDPLARRGIGILLQADQASTAGAVGSIVDSIRAQVFRPREAAIQADPDWPPAGGLIDALAKLGIASRVVAGRAGEVTGPASTAAWPALVAATSATWVVAWPAGAIEPNDLLDLALAAESSRAEAVGFVDGSTSRFVADLPIAGSLIRRELVVDPERWAPVAGPGTGLSSLARRGERLFGTTKIAQDGQR